MSVRPVRPAPRHRRRLATAAALALVVPLVLTACGGGDARPGPAAGAGSPGGGFPVSVRSGPLDGGTELTIEQRPDTIVSLSPTATETLWAVGAGAQVVAVDNQSDYPADVPVTDLSGYSPNIEAILRYQPDLVIAMYDNGGLVSGLKAARVPTLMLPAVTDLGGVYSQIERVGAATGHVAEAAATVASMRHEIDATLAGLPERDRPLTYYHELDDTLYTVSSSTFIGEIYRLLGLTNIADAAGSGDAYPQLSAEYVVSADPDLIFLADGRCCGVTPEKVAQRPGWAGLSAVRHGRVYVLDEDVASRWGPRTVDLVTTLGAIVAGAQPAPAR